MNEQAKAIFIKENVKNWQTIDPYSFKDINDIAHLLKRSGFYKNRAHIEMIEEAVRNILLQVQGKKKMYKKIHGKGLIVDREKL